MTLFRQIQLDMTILCYLSVGKQVYSQNNLYTSNHVETMNFSQSIVNFEVELPLQLGTFYGFIALHFYDFVKCQIV